MSIEVEAQITGNVWKIETEVGAEVEEDDRGRGGCCFVQDQERLAKKVGGRRVCLNQAKVKG